MLLILADYPNCFVEPNGQIFEIENYVDAFSEKDPTKFFWDIEQAADDDETEPRTKSRKTERLRYVFAACLALQHERNLTDLLIF